MKWLISIAICSGVILYSCSDEEERVIFPVPPGNVMLSNPQPGQQSMYLRYTMLCGSILGNFTYTGDTLLLETIVDSEGIKFKETFTNGSPLFSGTSSIYPVSLSGTDLIIPERSSSALFFFYGDDVIHLAPGSMVELKQSSCKLNLNNQNFIGNEIGFVKEFKAGPIRQVNKTAVSCVPLIYSLDA